jgi:hypothetical protein
MHRWRIFRARGHSDMGLRNSTTTPLFLGVVEAIDERDAIAKAIEEFNIADPLEQQRLLAERRDE